MAAPHASAYQVLDDVAVADVLDQTAARLIGECARARRGVTAGAAQQSWLDTIAGIRAARQHALHTGDRTEMIKMVEHWSAEADRLAAHAF